MPVKIPAFAAGLPLGAMLAVAMVAGAYFYARHRVQNALKQVPGKIGARHPAERARLHLFPVRAGRTLFKIQAAKAIFKLAAGRNSKESPSHSMAGIPAVSTRSPARTLNTTPVRRRDRQGQVQIDLEANPAGLTSPDRPPQGIEKSHPPRDQRSGFQSENGQRPHQEKVDFRISAGQRFGGRRELCLQEQRTLTLDSQVQIAFTGPTAPPHRRARNHHQGSSDDRAAIGAHLQQGVAARPGGCRPRFS